MEITKLDKHKYENQPRDTQIFLQQKVFIYFLCCPLSSF